MTCIEGTVDYDTPTSVVLRLKKRNIAHVMPRSSDPETSLVPRPTGSDIQRLIAADSVRAHPAFATTTAAQISSHICSITARKEFRTILEAGQWCSRAQTILETWLLKAPRHWDRPPAIEDARSDPMVVSSASSSSDSSSSSSSSSDADASHANHDVDLMEEAMPDRDDMVKDDGHDAVPYEDGLQPVASGFDVTTLADDEIEQHPHWVNLNDQVDKLMADNERLERLADEGFESQRIIKRLRLMTENQARLIASLQNELGFVQ